MIIFQQARFKGVGKVSQPACNKNESCFSVHQSFPQGIVLLLLKVDEWMLEIDDLAAERPSKITLGAS